MNRKYSVAEMKHHANVLCETFENGYAGIGRPIGVFSSGNVYAYNWDSNAHGTRFQSALVDEQIDLFMTSTALDLDLYETLAAILRIDPVEILMMCLS